jgi:hypothetical protein
MQAQIQLTAFATLFGNGLHVERWRQTGRVHDCAQWLLYQDDWMPTAQQNMSAQGYFMSVQN